MVRATVGSLDQDPHVARLRPLLGTIVVGGERAIFHTPGKVKQVVGPPAGLLAHEREVLARRAVADAANRERMTLEHTKFGGAAEFRLEHPDANMLTRAPTGVDTEYFDSGHAEFGERSDTGGGVPCLDQTDDAIKQV